MNRFPRINLSKVFFAFCFLVSGCLSSSLVSVEERENPSESHAPPLCDEYGSPQKAGRIVFAGLKEISGMAMSRRYPNVLWVHNDSGDGPNLYAVSISGQLLGTITLAGADAVDWEDMAIGPCGAEECFYVGDIGDNDRRRDDCAIYRTPLPSVDPIRPFGEITLEHAERFSFSYPDGPHNAESLAVHPNGTVYILTKEKRGRSVVFRFRHLTPGVKNIPEPVGLLVLGEHSLEKITGADFHPSGRRLLIRTYQAAFELPLDSADIGDGIRKGHLLSVPAAMDQQNEAITYDPVRGGYWHVSEGLRPYLYYVGCERGGGPIP